MALGQCNGHIFKPGRSDSRASGSGTHTGNLYRVESSVWRQFVLVGACRSPLYLSSHPTCLEFRHCRLATIGLAVAWLFFCLRSVMLLGYDLGLPAPWQVSIEGGSTLGMVALVGCGFLWYARHVLLDVEGRLPARAGKNKKVSKASTSSDISRETNVAAGSRPRGRSDLEPDTSRRAAELVDEAGYDAAGPEEESSAMRRAKDSRKQRSHTQSDRDCEEMPEHRTREQQRKLSKAERKKLRKLKAKERHAA